MKKKKIIIYKPVTNNGNLMEKKLFVNTIIAAYNAQAVNPELMFVKQSDRNAAQEIDGAVQDPWGICAICRKST